MKVVLIIIAVLTGIIGLFGAWPALLITVAAVVGAAFIPGKTKNGSAPARTGGIVPNEDHWKIPAKAPDAKPGPSVDAAIERMNKERADAAAYRKSRERSATDAAPTPNAGPERDTYAAALVDMLDAESGN